MTTLQTNKCQLKLIPQLGGILTDLQLFNGQDTIAVLEGYQSEVDEEANVFCKGHFLLPFPNRMKNGQYNFDGQSYQFPINDTNLGHSLHGFLEQIPMKVTKKEERENRATIQLKGSFEGLPYFPFSFNFFVRYQLTASQLTIQIRIKNTGDSAMPIGVGWHPYFKLDASKIDTLKMQFPKCELVEIDHRMMPTGRTIPYTDFSKKTPIGNRQLDNCFIVDSTKEKAVILLQSNISTLKVWQDTNTFPYFQIYTPDSRTSIAIEPMTCNIDAFNNQGGLWILESKEERKMNFGVSLLED